MNVYGKIAATVGGWSIVAIVGMTSLVGLSYSAVQQDTKLFRLQTREQVAEATRDIARNVDDTLGTLKLFADRLARASSQPNYLDDVTLTKVEDLLEALHPEMARVSIDLMPEARSPYVAPAPRSDNASLDEPTLTGTTGTQGGASEFVIRYPILGDAANGAAPKFIGTISATVPGSTFLKPRVDAVPLTSPLAIALRVRETAGEQVFGASGLMSADPVIQPIEFSDGRWDIIAVPAGGWPQVSPDFNVTLALVIMLTLATVVGITGTHYLVYHRQRSHKLLSNAIEAIDAGFVLYDENDKLVVCNTEFTNQFGDLKGVVRRGTPYETLIRIAGGARQGDSRDARRGWIDQRLAEHADGQEFLINRPDGTWGKISETRTADGFSVSIITDITDQKEAQLAAETANRQKTEFLSTVTHELRTPLTVISGYSQILSQPAMLAERVDFLRTLKAQETVQSGLLRAAAAYDETVMTYGSKIGGWADHMLKLVNDLLDWAQLERDTVALHRECVDVRKLVDTLVQDMTPQAEAKGLTLSADRVEGLVMADHQRLKQVLMNLVGNAIKFTGEGSVRIEAVCKDDRLVLSVADTGIGIPEEDLERIFERFQQVDNSSTRSFGGFGLGLSIARRIVDLHDGTISVTSGQGRGTRFTVELPDAARGAEGLDAPRVQAKAG
ncbi:sensor histidine kinase [Pseudooceanicola sp.]|uniref:sensor histidine kinase n=1 Tax=Pseudooceanicola sp. TaxID=1914328 RepID=UPI004059F5D6